jgi:hypothetical protein
VAAITRRPLDHHLLPENNWRLGRPKSPSGRLGEEKNMGFEPRTVQPVTQSLNCLHEQVTVLSKKKHNDQAEEQQNPVSM